jgi:hypothetical protein
MSNSVLMSNSALANLVPSYKILIFKMCNDLKVYFLENYLKNTVLVNHKNSRLVTEMFCLVTERCCLVTEIWCLVTENVEGRDEKRGDFWAKDDCQPKASSEKGFRLYTKWEQGDQMSLSKIAQNVHMWPNPFLSKLMQNLNCGNNSQTVWATSAIKNCQE